MRSYKIESREIEEATKKFTNVKSRRWDKIGGFD